MIKLPPGYFNLLDWYVSGSKLYTETTAPTEAVGGIQYRS